VSDYLRISCRLPADREDDLAGAVGDLGLLGSQLEAVDERAVRATVYLPAARSDAVAELTARLAALGAVELAVEPFGRADWLAAYRSTVRPHGVGRRWWMDPHPDSPTAAPEGRWRLTVEPRMAFGTGSHESTQLALVALEELAERWRAVAGATVLDVGTGSGVLALAAERLGATWVVGLDVDPEAVWVARQIAAQQEWPAQPRYLIGPVAALGRATFDLVVCNMIPEQALPLLPELRRLVAVEGWLVLSGLLGSQAREVGRTLGGHGLEVAETHTCGEWACLWARPGRAR
jgi:ribosomal protein L11 methyltransferase